MNIATAGRRQRLRQALSVTAENLFCDPANPPAGAGQINRQPTPESNRSSQFGAVFHCLVTLLSLAVLAPVAAANTLPQAGLVLHLEANAGIQTRGQNISLWRDQSGNGQDLRGTGSPRIQANALNKKPVVVFDAHNDRLRQVSASSLPIHGNIER